MQNGPKTIMSARQPRPAASFAARSKRWTSSAARPEPKGSQNAQRNYERYLALARAEAQIGNTVGGVRGSFKQQSTNYDRSRTLSCPPPSLMLSPVGRMAWHELASLGRL